MFVICSRPARTYCRDQRFDRNDLLQWAVLPTIKALTQA